MKVKQEQNGREVCGRKAFKELSGFFVHKDHGQNACFCFNLLPLIR
ncbi:hypothetical protein [Marinospirillum perlucidum]|nr:hypothetical protein [Marinospirillum perlucidum]